MADIELVIKIPEKTVNEIKDNAMFAGTIPSEILWDVTSAIVNRTPLPKGHGKLGDLDILLNKAMNHCKTYSEAEDSYCRGKLHAYELYAEEVENADTIIEADKTESEGNHE